MDAEFWKKAAGDNPAQALRLLDIYEGNERARLKEGPELQAVREFVAEGRREFRAMLPPERTHAKLQRRAVRMCLQ